MSSADREIHEGVKELVRREEMQVWDCGFDSQWARFGGKMGVGEDVRVVGGSLARERRWRRELGRRNGMEWESGWSLGRGRNGKIGEGG